MENEKNEMKKKPGKVLPWLAAVLLAAALAARAAVPVPAGLFMQIWNIGTQLIILFSGLVLFSAAARAVFQRVSPSSNHGKTVFTLADSAIRYLLIRGAAVGAVYRGRGCAGAAGWRRRAGADHRLRCGELDRRRDHRYIHAV